MVRNSHYPIRASARSLKRKLVSAAITVQNGESLDGLACCGRALNSLHEGGRLLSIMSRALGTTPASITVECCGAWQPMRRHGLQADLWGVYRRA